MVKLANAVKAKWRKIKAGCNRLHGNDVCSKLCDTLGIVHYTQRQFKDFKKLIRNLDLEPSLHSREMYFSYHRGREIKSIRDLFYQHRMVDQWIRSTDEVISYRRK